MVQFWSDFNFLKAFFSTKCRHIFVLSNIVIYLCVNVYSLELICVFTSQYQYFSVLSKLISWYILSMSSFSKVPETSLYLLPEPNTEDLIRKQKLSQHESNMNLGLRTSTKQWDNWKVTKFQLGTKVWTELNPIKCSNRKEIYINKNNTFNLKWF